MRRPRLWLGLGAALVLVAVAVIVCLPAVVRWASVRQLEDMLGREVAVADVDVNLFTRALAFVEVRVAGRAEDAPPLLAIPRLEVDFRYLPLFRGRAHLERLAIHAPEVHVVRTDDGRLSVQDVIDRLAARPAGRALPFVVETAVLHDGRVVLHDRAIRPDRTWRATDLDVQIRDVSTVAQAPGGTASARLTVAGAPVTVEATEIGVRPAHARATVAVQGLDLAPLALYVREGAPVRPVRGQFTTRVRLAYDAQTGLQAASDTVVQDLVLARPEQEEDFVTFPTLQVSSRGLRHDHGRFHLGRVEVTGAPTVVDASLQPPQRYDVRSLELVAEDLAYPAEAPGDVTLSATLPDGGSLQATGTLALVPVDTHLQVHIAGAVLSRLRPYVSRASPIQLTRGMGTATLDVRYAGSAGLRVSGDLRLRHVILMRKGQREPFITHPDLRAAIVDLVVRDSTVAVDRLTIEGAPTIVDASVSPTQRFDIQALSLTVNDFAWPAGGPAKLTGLGRLAAGASATVTGTFDPGSLATAVTAHFEDVPVQRIAGYLPPDGAVEVAGGRVMADIAVGYRRGGPLRIDGNAVVHDGAIASADTAAPILVLPALELGVAGLVVDESGVTVRRVTVEGTPTLTVPGTAEPLELRGLSLAAERVGWPARRPARVSLLVELPQAGTVSASGEVRLDTGAIELRVEASDAALAPYAAILGLRAPVDGRLDATATVTGTGGAPLRLEAQGAVTARQLRLGPAEQPVMTVKRLELEGVEAHWPEAVHVARVVIERPSALIEREADGSFPLRAMLTPEEEEPAAALPGPRSGEGGPPPAPRPRLDVTVPALHLIEGDARFVDRTTAPFYSEEITNLALRIEGLSTAPDSRAQVAGQGIIGADAALDLQGEMAPFAEPFFLEVSGQMRRFSVPRTNPYLRRFLDWVARRGELTTEVHYRIEGRQLEATNEILVRRLDVAPAGRDPDKLIGLPLGLVVSLLKNPQGDIRLTVPVSGDLSQPQFSFGDAITTAFKNVLGRVVTGPFRAIGRVLRGEDEIEGVEIDPVVFEPGSAVVRAEAAKQVQRVADFLRASPYVRLELTPVVTDDDVQAIKTEEVAAGIQRRQRQAGLDFRAAATALYRERFPDRAPPAELDTLVAELAQAQPVSEEAVNRLRQRRAESTRQALTDAAGIVADRLVEAPAPPVGAGGQPRVNLAFAPGG